MTSKIALYERRHTLFTLMCSPAKPSIADVYPLIKQRFPDITLKGLQNDWDARAEWMGTIARLNDPTIIEQCIVGIQGIAKHAFGVYVRCVANGNYTTAVSALNCVLACNSRLLSYSVGVRVSFNQTNNFTVFNKPTFRGQLDAVTMPSTDNFKETLMKAVALKQHIELTKTESEKMNTQSNLENGINNSNTPDEINREVKT